MQRADPTPLPAPRPRRRAGFTIALVLALAAVGCAEQRFARLFDETENNYYTKLRVTVDGAVARLAVVEDTSILPALNDSCTIALEGR
jgi:ferric-dicitrate binding protein FerR (iron transport regulator)